MAPYACVSATARRCRGAAASAAAVGAHRRRVVLGVLHVETARRARAYGVAAGGDGVVAVRLPQRDDRARRRVARAGPQYSGRVNVAARQIPSGASSPRQPSARGAAPQTRRHPKADGRNSRRRAAGQPLQSGACASSQRLPLRRRRHVLGARARQRTTTTRDISRRGVKRAVKSDCAAMSFFRFLFIAFAALAAVAAAAEATRASSRTTPRPTVRRAAAASPSYAPCTRTAAYHSQPCCAAAPPLLNRRAIAPPQTASAAPGRPSHEGHGDICKIVGPKVKGKKEL